MAYKWRPANESLIKKGNNMNDINSIEKPSKGFVVTGWIIFAVAVPTLFIPPIGQILWCILLIMLGMDASKINVNVLKKSTLELSNTDRLSVAEWVCTSLFLGIIVFPIYLIKRNKLANAAYHTINENLYMSEEELSKIKKKNVITSIIYALIVLGLILAIGVGFYLFHSMG